jgi:hypothetical protein
VISAPPSVTTLPPMVAVVGVMLVAVGAETVGASRVSTRIPPNMALVVAACRAEPARSQRKESISVLIPARIRREFEI